MVNTFIMGSLIYIYDTLSLTWGKSVTRWLWRDMWMVMYNWVLIAKGNLFWRGSYLLSKCDIYLVLRMYWKERKYVQYPCEYPYQTHQNHKQPEYSSRYQLRGYFAAVYQGSMTTSIIGRLEFFPLSSRLCQGQWPPQSWWSTTWY